MPSTPRYCVIDLIAFEARQHSVGFTVARPRPNKHIVKELAVVDEDGNTLRHVLLRPPTNFYTLESAAEKRAVREWQDATGLVWNYGYEDYARLEELLKAAVPIEKPVYCKGAVKAKILKRLLGRGYDVVDLDDYDCPALEVLHLLNTTAACPFNHEACALKNAVGVGAWWAEAKRMYDVIDKVGRNIEAVYSFGFLPPDEREMRALPKQFLLTYARDRIPQYFDRLPARLKNDEDIQGEAHCVKHSDPRLSLAADTCGSGFVRRKHCKDCIREREEAED